MLGVMFQKLWHKKWMVLCLLIGSVLLIATVVSFPMYRGAAFDRMLRDEFEQELTESGRWPAMFSMGVTSKKDIDTNLIEQTEAYIASLYEQFSITEKDTIAHYSTTNMKSVSLMNREDLNPIFFRLAMITGLSDHIEIAVGEMYSEDGLAEDGSIEVIISQDTMISTKLLVGETLEIEKLTDESGNPVRIRIVGAYKKHSETPYFWQAVSKDNNNCALISEQLFRQMFTGEAEVDYTVNCRYYPMFEYKDLTTSDVDVLYDGTNQLLEHEKYGKEVKQTGYLSIIERYREKKSKIEATLFILQVPVLILLGAFLFMISTQMYDMERNEISVLKSRGASGGQIFRLYFYQSVFLTGAGVVLGLPLGALFCRILGSTRNFLEFDTHGSLEISYSADVALYAVGAFVVSVLIMTLPALKHSRLTIVKLKQQKALKSKSLWEKCFLDIICLALGGYGYYNFATNRAVLIENVLRGKSLDPLLYFSSSVFIVGAGLLFLRIQPLLVKGIYLLGKNHWGPASYASFMENLKNGRKQQFIMLFLILTISLGMYHATVARTILQNALDNAAYLDGADVIIKELWETNPLYELDDTGTETRYIEPDYFKYGLLESVKGYTKVLYDEAGYVSQAKNGRVLLTVMGIHTKEFGENTSVKDGLLEKPYYTYLNELAVEPEGVLVSDNFRTVLGYKIGDRVLYSDSLGRNYTGKIVDFFSYWPGYKSSMTVLNKDGSISEKDSYMVVGHYSTLMQKWGSLPYEVWMSMKPESDSGEFYQWIEENDIQLKKYVNRSDNQEKVMEDPLLQGTNGVLTMGFIVTMILCVVGYMIYWVMSIRSREMMFGVLRACGMHKSELFHMLINEQIFSGVFSVLAGIGIGRLASVMFVPILQTAYAAADQVLPMQMIVNQTDMLRLYSVIAGAMSVCLVVLIVLVFKLNISKALKLGEE